MEASEATTREKEDLLKWEVEAKRVIKKYETLDGRINTATKKPMLEAFLKDER